MDNRTPRNRIRYALDARLSGITERPGSYQRVLRQARGERKVKRKMSLGLVLLLILLLISITALAVALLSAREIAEQHAIPMANQSEGDSYSVEETNVLLALAEENGVALSETARASINKFLGNGQGYYKEEMLMALAKAEFGEAPASWTLEEQKWFDDVCVAIGFLEKPQKAIPAADEISQNQAEQIAEEYIHSHYDKSVDLHDASVYKRGIQFKTGMRMASIPAITGRFSWNR